MKAHEVLKQYANGRRDFSGENLRGQSFKGKDLSGANFSASDIRGANFTNAKLTGTNFNRAKAGLQHRWATGLVIASWLLSGLSGVFSIFLGVVVALIFDNKISNVIAGWVTLIAIAIFFIVTIRKGLIAALGTFAVAVAGAVAVTVAVTGGVALAVLGAVAVAVAVAVTVAVAGAVAGAGAVAVVLLSAYLSWRALKGDDRDAWIRTVAIAVAATGGTSFRHADLTDADFTSATLKSTDFRNATLTRTNLHQAQKLDRARVGDTILIDAKIRDLVVTHRLKELLAQLQEAIDDPTLTDDYKTQALEQIKVLAEAGQNPKNKAAQKQAKKALGFLKIIAEGLPSAATLVVACQSILPAIAQALLQADRAFLRSVIRTIGFVVIPPET